ncbi:MAG: GAF domain-containing protein, partial [Verrucomicrobiae bacterium]|nr:GAF domain-containing protein [Verrucomicrobiae bacterium]
CLFVRKSSQTFVTQNSLIDPRVVAHPKRLEVKSYCGVPLVDLIGNVFGTVCHFDFAPRPISDNDVALLELFASLLKERDAWLQRRPSLANNQPT